MKYIFLTVSILLTACSTTSFERDQIAADLVERWECQSGAEDSNWYVNDWAGEGDIVGNCRDYAITLRYAIEQQTGVLGDRVSAYRFTKDDTIRHVYLCFDDGVCYDQNRKHKRQDIERRWFRVMDKQFPYNHDLIVYSNRFK